MAHFMGMSFPPPGYDDSTVVPEQRLKILLSELEEELDKIRLVYQQYLPGQFEKSPILDRDFWVLRIAAEELGEDYAFLADKIISDYENFQSRPSQEALEQIVSNVKSLQLLLVG